MCEEIVAQIVLHPAAHTIHQLAHPVSECATDDRSHDDESAQLPNAAHRSTRADSIDGTSQQPGYDTGDRRRREHDQEPGCKRDPVRLVIWRSSAKVLHIWHVDCRPQSFMSLVLTQATRGGDFMVQYIPRLNATLVLSAALFIGACAKTDNNTAAADSALNKDIQMANRDTAAQPALTDVPASS